MKCPLILLVLISISSILKAQDDFPDDQEERFHFVPGLYLSFEDFIYNDPIRFDQAEGDFQEFFLNPMNSNKITITGHDSVYQVEQAAVWGYTDGKGVFLNRSLFKGMNLDIVALKMKVTPWVKIHTIGTLSFISYFTTVETRNLALLQPKKFAAKSDFLLNTNDGKFYSGNLYVLKLLIADDPDLLAEFERTRGDKEVKFYTYLRKYNERHPIKFN